MQVWIRENAEMAARWTKIALFFAFAAMLYHELWGKSDSAAIGEAFLRTWKSGNTGGWLVAALALVPVNWAAETLKWQPLLQKSFPFSFIQAFKAVLAGVTFSLFTPNRVGEYGGRILFVPTSEAGRAVFANVVGSLAQQIMLYTFGFVGYIHILRTFWTQHSLAWLLILVLGVIFIAIFLFCFLNMELIVPVFKKISWIRRQKWIRRNVGIVRSFTREDLYSVLSWSFFRYVVYVVQYFLMLRFFGISVDFWTAMSCIATIYIIQTALPLPPVVSLMARGEVALNIWGMFEADKITILATTFCLWFVNLILPALVGLWLMLRSDVAKNWFLGEKKA